MDWTPADHLIISPGMRAWYGFRHALPTGAPPVEFSGEAEARRAKRAESNRKNGQAKAAYRRIKELRKQGREAEAIILEALGHA